jgi:hypothetical protein
MKVRTKRIWVHFNRYRNVLDWHVAVAASSAWRGVIRGYGSTPDEAFLDLEDNIHRQVPGDYEIVWEEDHQEGIAL